MLLGCGGRPVPDAPGPIPGPHRRAKTKWFWLQRWGKTDDAGSAGANGKRLHHPLSKNHEVI